MADNYSNMLPPIPRKSYPIPTKVVKTGSTHSSKVTYCSNWKPDTQFNVGDYFYFNKNYEYYLLNKPKGVVTTTSDEKGRTTVVDLIDTTTRIYPVGRLDYDTTGILILTNDGELANLLMRPDSLVDKTYIAKVEGIVIIPSLQKLRNGVIIDGVKTKKARVRLKSYDKKKDTSVVEITIHEGKNHQIKKMLESVGNKVIKLRRERYANLNLKGLMPGEYRPLTIKEVKILYSLCKK